MAGLQEVIVGVDGGGTSSALIAVNGEGDVLAVCEGGGINYHTIGMPAARENLRGAMEQLLRQAGAGTWSRLYLGVAALDVGADEATKRAFCGDAFDPVRVSMWSDAYMTLIGHTLGEPGVIAISGTGALVMLKDEAGQISLRAGWGYLMDDKGSSYHIAKRGFQAAIAFWEGDQGGQALAREVQARYRLGHPRELIDRIYADGMKASELAQFATTVLSLARDGDAASAAIVEEAVDYLAIQTVRLTAKLKVPPKVGVHGGLFQHNPWVKELYLQKMRKQRQGIGVVDVALPPQAGCIIQYYLDTGLLDQARVDKLRGAVA